MKKILFPKAYFQAIILVLEKSAILQNRQCYKSVAMLFDSSNSGLVFPPINIEFRTGENKKKNLSTTNS